MLHSGPKIVLGHIGDLKNEENSLEVDDNDDIGNCINKGEVNLLLLLRGSPLELLVLLRFNGCFDKVACRVKINTTLTTKDTSFHYFSKKFKTNTLQCHKMYIKIFELEINNLCIKILAAKMT